MSRLSLKLQKHRIPVVAKSSTATPPLRTSKNDPHEPRVNHTGPVIRPRKPVAIKP